MKLHHWFFNGKSHAFFQFEDIEFVPSLENSWEKYACTVGLDHDIIIESYRPRSLHVEVVSLSHSNEIDVPNLPSAEPSTKILHPVREKNWSAHFTQHDAMIRLQVSSGHPQKLVRIDEHVSILLSNDRFCGIHLNAPLDLCRELYRTYVC